jgi:DNA-binding FadR family transcriptional regulator
LLELVAYYSLQNLKPSLDAISEGREIRINLGLALRYHGGIDADSRGQENRTPKGNRKPANLRCPAQKDSVTADAARDEGLAAMSASNNAFHMAIAESAGNRHVTNLYKNLLPGFYPLSHSLLSSAKLSSFSYKDYFARVSDEHQSIIAAIASRDADAADEMARNHAKLICERVMA